VDLLVVAAPFQAAFFFVRPFLLFPSCAEMSPVPMLPFPLPRGTDQACRTLIADQLHPGQAWPLFPVLASMIRAATSWKNLKVAVYPDVFFFVRPTFGQFLFVVPFSSRTDSSSCPFFFLILSYSFERVFQVIDESRLFFLSRAHHFPTFFFPSLSPFR